MTKITVYGNTTTGFDIWIKFPYSETLYKSGHYERRPLYEAKRSAKSLQKHFINSEIIIKRGEL